MAIVAPSLLAANFINLQAECDMLNQSVADWFFQESYDQGLRCSPDD
jgi:ribulose-phosphate 3-epimerase